MEIKDHPFPSCKLAGCLKSHAALHVLARRASEPFRRVRQRLLAKAALLRVLLAAVAAFFRDLFRGSLPDRLFFFFIIAVLRTTCLVFTIATARRGSAPKGTDAAPIRRGSAPKGTDADHSCPCRGSNPSPRWLRI